MDNSISLIVPIFNAGRYLERCLKSIKEQSHVNFEVLMCDDGSTDNSSDICRQFANEDTRFKYNSQCNLGPAAARNLGLQKAGNRFIAFADADDFVHPDYLKLLLKPFKHRKISMTCCGFKELSVTNPLGLSLNYFSKQQQSLYISIFQEKVFEGLGGVVWSKLFIRDIIVRNRIVFNKNVRLSEDLLFVLEYSKYIKNVAVVSENLYYYNRLNDSGLTRKLKIENLEDLKITNYEILRLLSKSTLPIYEITSRRSRNFLLNLLSQISIENKSMRNIILDFKYVKKQVSEISTIGEISVENYTKILFFNNRYLILFIVFSRIMHFLKSLHK